MLTESYLDTARKVLAGEMSHAELISTKESMHVFNARHRATTVMAILLVHKDQCCVTIRNSRLLTKPGLGKTFLALLSPSTYKAAAEASTKLALHRTSEDRSITLTPPPNLVAVTRPFNPTSTGVMAFMKAAKAHSLSENSFWLPWHTKKSLLTEGSDDDTAFFNTYRERLSDPAFAAAVLAQLHRDEPTRISHAINSLSSAQQAAARRMLG